MIGAIVLLLVWLLFPKAFERFRLEGFEPRRCEHYFESCLCFGRLNTAENYPPQYNCVGLETCNEINKYVPESCKPDAEEESEEEF